MDDSGIGDDDGAAQGPVTLPGRFTGAVDTLRRRSSSKNKAAIGLSGSTDSNTSAADNIAVKRAQLSPSSTPTSTTRRLSLIPLKGGDDGAVSSPRGSLTSSRSPGPMPNSIASSASATVGIESPPPQMKRLSFLNAAPLDSTTDSTDDGSDYSESEDESIDTDEDDLGEPELELMIESNSLSGVEGVPGGAAQSTFAEGRRRSKWATESDWPHEMRRPSLVSGMTTAADLRRPSILGSSGGSGQSSAIPSAGVSSPSHAAATPLSSTVSSSASFASGSSNTPYPLLGGMSGPTRNSLTSAPERRPSISTSGIPPGLAIGTREAPPTSSSPPQSPVQSQPSPLSHAATRRGSMFGSSSGSPSPVSADGATRRSSVLSDSRRPSMLQSPSGTVPSTPPDSRRESGAPHVDNGFSRDDGIQSTAQGSSKRPSVAGTTIHESPEDGSGDVESSEAFSSFTTDPTKGSVSGSVGAAVSSLKRGIHNLRRRSSLLGSPTHPTSPQVQSSTSSSLAAPQASSGVRARSPTPPNPPPPMVLITSDSSRVPLNHVGLPASLGVEPVPAGHAMYSSTGLPPDNVWPEPRDTSSISASVKTSTTNGGSTAGAASIAQSGTDYPPPPIVGTKGRSTNSLSSGRSSISVPPPAAAAHSLHRSSVSAVSPLRFTPTVERNLETVRARFRAAITALKDKSPQVGDVQQADGDVVRSRPVLALFYQMCNRATVVPGARRGKGRAGIGGGSAGGSHSRSQSAASMGTISTGSSGDDLDDPDAEMTRQLEDPKITSAALMDVMEKLLGVIVSEGEVQALEAVWGGPGWLSIRETVVGFGGGLNQRRLDVVRDAYEVLLERSKANTGTVMLKEAKSHFNPLEHPRVRSGEMTSDDALAEFVDFFTVEEDVRHGGVIRAFSSGESGGKKMGDLTAIGGSNASSDYGGRVLIVARKGAIELIEWEYYWGDSDEYFCRLLFGIWVEVKLEAKTRARESWSNPSSGIGPTSVPVPVTPSLLATAALKGSKEELKGLGVKNKSATASRMTLAKEGGKGGTEGTGVGDDKDKNATVSRLALLERMFSVE
ncbi:hypothetical protein HDU93_006246 [Gonapodya sp. JEL0774]|nr:hypothetical protein HDU93_006246 [Gonapodya sp. JEL0774]